MLGSVVAAVRWSAIVEADYDLLVCAVTELIAVVRTDTATTYACCGLLGWDAICVLDERWR